jgi:hypothetical protein
VPPFPFADVEATLTGCTASAWTRCSGRSTRRRSPARRLRRCISRNCRRHAVAVKVLRPRIAQVIEKDISLMHAGATLVGEALVRRQEAAAARRSSPSSRRRCAMSSTSRARPRTARNCAATSSVRRCSSSRPSTGTTAAPR